MLLSLTRIAVDGEECDRPTKGRCPQMIGYLAAREIRSLVLSWRAIVLVAGMILLAVAVTLSSSARYSDATLSARASTRQHATWLRKARAYIEMIPAIEVEPNPLQGLSGSGYRPLATTVVIPGWYAPVSLISGREATNPFLDALADLDLARVISLLATLLVVFLGFDAITGPRERGVLKSVMALGATPRQILLSKYLACAVVAGIAAAVAHLVWYVGMLLAGHSELASAPAIGAVVAHLVLSLLLVSVFAAGTIAVSSLSSSSGQSLLTLILLWMLAAAVAPDLTSQVARLLRPDPPPQAAAAGTFTPGRVPGETAEPPTSEYAAMSVCMLPPLRDYGDEFVAGLYDEQRINRLLEQCTLNYLLGLISPVGCFLASSAKITGLDPIAHVALLRECLHYQQTLKEWQESKVRAAPHRSRVVISSDPPLDTRGFPFISRGRVLERDLTEAGLSGIRMPWLGLAALLLWNLAMLALLLAPAVRPGIGGAVHILRSS